MGVAIANLDDFEAKFEERKHRSDLFGFFLFDERPSQRAVGTFATQQFPWLDRLAASARMFFFVFLRHNPEWDEDVENPGLEVAQRFGIRPNELPGIVLFTLDEDKEKVTKAAYLPLKAELFETDPKRVEELFADLFSVIQHCREQSPDTVSLIACVDTQVNSIIRSETVRPVKAYLLRTLGDLKDLPGKLLQTVVSAAVEGATRQGMPVG